MWADTDQNKLDRDINLRHDGEDDTFYWRLVKDSGLQDSQTLNRYNTDKTNNPSGVAGFDVQEYYRAWGTTSLNLIENIKGPWHNLVHVNSGFYSNNIYDRPTPVYIEKLMRKLDEVAVAHDWITYDASNELIGESGFHWLKYYGTIEQHFIPNSGRPYQLNGYPLSSIAFWERLDKALIFAYERCGAKPSTVVADNAFDPHQSGNFRSYSQVGLDDDQYLLNENSYGIERMGLNKWRQSDPHFTVQGDIDSGVLNVVPTGDIRYYFGPNMLDIPHMIFDPNGSGEALFCNSNVRQEASAFGESVRYSGFNEAGVFVSVDPDEIPHVPPFSENTNRSFDDFTASGIKPVSPALGYANNLFHGYRNDFFYQNMNMSGLQHQRGLSRAQYQSVVDMWWGLCGNATTLREDPDGSDRVPNFFLDTGPRVRTLWKKAEILYDSDLFDATTQTIQSLLPEPEIDVCEDLFKNTRWFQSQTLFITKIANVISSSIFVNNLSSNAVGRFPPRVVHAYDYAESKQFKNFDTGILDEEILFNAFGIRECVPRLFNGLQRNHIISHPIGETHGQRGSISMQAAIQYALYPISLRSLHQPEVSVVLPYYGIQLKEVNKALPITNSPNIAMNEHFRNKHSIPLRSKIGYTSDQIGSGYFKGNLPAQELNWQGASFDAQDLIGYAVIRINLRQNLNTCQEANVGGVQTPAANIQNHWDGLQDLLIRNTDTRVQLVYGYIDVFGEAKVNNPCPVFPIEVDSNNNVAINNFGQATGSGTQTSKIDDVIVDKLINGDYFEIKEHSMSIFAEDELPISSSTSSTGRERFNFPDSASMTIAHDSNIEPFDLIDMYTRVPPSGATHIFVAVKPVDFEMSKFRAEILDGPIHPYHAYVLKCEALLSGTINTNTCSDLKQSFEKYSVPSDLSANDIGIFQAGLTALSTPSVTGIRSELNVRSNFVDFIPGSININGEMGFLVDMKLNMPSGTIQPLFLNDPVRYVDLPGDNNDEGDNIIYYGSGFQHTFPYYY